MTIQRAIRTVCIVLTLALGWRTTNSAQAAILYSLEFDGPTLISLGGTASIGVYLRETRTAGESSILGDPLFGAISGNFSITRSGLGNNSITGVFGNPIFDDQIGSTFNASSASVLQQDLNPVPTPFGSPSGPNSDRLLLGSFTVLGSNVLNDTNTFSFLDPDNLNDDLVLGDGTVLDGAVSFGSHTVVSAPEPSTTALLGMAGVGFAVRQWRKRRTKSEQSNTQATA